MLLSYIGTKVESVAATIMTKLDLRHSIILTRIDRGRDLSLICIKLTRLNFKASIDPAHFTNTLQLLLFTVNCCLISCTL